MRITAAAPANLVEAANNLAMCLAFSAADGETYRGLNWQDAAGNQYSAASFEASDTWIEVAQAPLTRPAWDVDGIIDMDAAAMAQAALVFAVGAVLAVPDKLTAIGGMEGIEALTAMGLVPRGDV